jgi:RNA-binding protein NOB1
MAAPTPTQQKAIHSLILDTGPLIKNAVSISTIINAAEELYTTPAILSEIRDEATRSRVQTTLVPFLKIRNPSPASYDAVIAFSKKTGDFGVLSRQDLGILALAYEVHCERNGGNFGLREAPKGPVKLRPEEEEREKAENAKKAASGEKETTETVEADDGWSKPVNKRNKGRKAKPTNSVSEVAQSSKEVAQGEVEDVEEGWAQPRGKRAAKSREAKPTKFNFEPVEESPGQEGVQQDDENTGEATEEGGVAVTQEQLQEQVEQQVQEQVVAMVEEQIQDQVHEQLQAQDKVELEEKVQEELHEQIEEKVHEQIEEQTGQQDQIQQPAAGESATKNIHIKDTFDLSVKPDSENAAASAAGNENLEQDMDSLNISEQSTPDFSASDSDSDGDWITPGNLAAHQEKDAGIQSHASTSGRSQMDVATMTTDFAMQNVLLQLNLKLLSTNMQRVKHVNTKVLRCHACFNIVKQMDKQFCPRCGQSTLQRVSCSTNAKGEFKIHLAKNYQYNKRGDKYSIPKPIAGTANSKWSGQGGGKGGWGRDLILAEDQKEYQKQVTDGQRHQTRDLMDADYLPGILTGDRGRAGGRVKVGAGKNVNAKKRT